MFSKPWAALLTASLSVLTAQPYSGGIEGRVAVRQLPAVVANRYAGADGAGTRTVEALPAVVYIEGAVPGSPTVNVRQPEMAQQDTAFQPPILIVPVGTTVRFPNQDKFFHNVFSYSKTKRFDLGRYPKGEAKTVTFDKPGGVAVFCEIHKWMRGAILVVENPYYAVVGSDGTFRIPNVPPGRYKVAVWHPERGKKTFNVVVGASGYARIDATI
jgi:plastocyanin